jgi:hypothetical protein
MIDNFISNSLQLTLQENLLFRKIEMIGADTENL